MIKECIFNMFFFFCSHQIQNTLAQFSVRLHTERLESTTPKTTIYHFRICTPLKKKNMSNDLKQFQQLNKQTIQYISLHCLMIISILVSILLPI
jgi:hypothetical protein